MFIDFVASTTLTRKEIKKKKTSPLVSMSLIRGRKLKNDLTKKEAKRNNTLGFQTILTTFCSIENPET
jgi:hypothetical protein